MIINKINRAIENTVNNTTVPKVFIKELLDKVNNINVTAFTTSCLQDIIEDIVLENNSDYNILQFLLEFQYHLILEEIDLSSDGLLRQSWLYHFKTLSNSGLPEELVNALADMKEEISDLALLLYIVKLHILKFNKEYLKRVQLEGM